MQIIKGERIALEQQVAKLIADKINNFPRNIVTIAFCGGSSVSGVFHQLLMQQVDWKKTRIFLTDERLVSLTDKDSNYKLLNDVLLSKLLDADAIQESNIIPFINNPDVKDSGVKQYNHELKSSKNHFDIILLSAGEDSHIASLFPNHPSINSKSKSYIKVDNSPKPPKQRISISPVLIRRSTHPILLFFGENKRKAFNNFNNPRIQLTSCPSKLVKEVKDSYVFTDLN